MKHVVTAARILVTAFGAFPGAPINPTQAILARLRRRRARLGRLGIELHEATLPVAFGTIDARLRQAVAECRPDAILHLGLAGRRKAVSVETRAANRVGLLHPDAEGRLPMRASLEPGGPSFVPCTYDSRTIEAAIRRLRVPVARSIDAGDYVCDATLYRALFDRSATCVGFLHVPRPRDRRRPVRRGAGQAPTIDQLTEAAFAAVLLMMRPGRLAAHRAGAAAPKAPPRDAGREDRRPPERAPDADRPAA